MFCNSSIISEFTGNLSLALDPHPPPQSPAHSDSLDVTSLQDTDLHPREFSSVHQPPSQILPTAASQTAGNVHAAEMHRGRSSAEQPGHIATTGQKLPAVKGMLFMIRLSGSYWANR